MADANIVFVDIVGYSKLSHADSEFLINSLNSEVIAELWQFRADPKTPLITLPTGDGMAIVLFDDREDNVEWTDTLLSLVERLLAWGKRNHLGSHKKTAIRIGVNRGPLKQFIDINGRPNVCGIAINDCQRIMDSAGENQVLFSKIAAEVIAGSGTDIDCNLRYQSARFSGEYSFIFEDPITIIAKHNRCLEVYAARQEKDEKRAIPTKFGQVIDGPNANNDRAECIVRCLESIAERSNPGGGLIKVFEQSVFSTLGISVNTASSSALVWRQKTLLNQLFWQNKIELTLILRCENTQHTTESEERFTALIEWFKKVQQSTKGIRRHLRFAFSRRMDEPNRMIIGETFQIDGYKHKDRLGYDLSICERNPDKIRDALKRFESEFKHEHASSQHSVDIESGLAHLELLRKKCQPVDPAGENSK
jgi:class 3 adenylate cyclase